MTTQRVNPVRGLLLVLMMLVGPTVFANEIYSTAAYREKCGGDVFPACNSWFASTGLNQWSMFEHAMQTAYIQGKFVLVITGRESLSISIFHYLPFTSETYGERELVDFVAKYYVLVPIDITRNGSRDVTKFLGIAHDEDQLAIYNPNRQETITRIRSLAFVGQHDFYSCDYTNDGRKERTTKYFNVYLEILKHPTQDFLEQKMKFNKDAHEECLAGMRKYIHGLEQKTKK